MTYTLLEMMEGKWIKGYAFKREEYSNTFIKDLAFLLNELHQYPHSKKYKPLEMFKIVQNFEFLLSHKDKDIRTFIEDTISEFKEIESELTGKMLLHGDLHKKNIIVDSYGNLQGLIDWKNMCIGDLHWEFRKIRCYIDWNGLEELLSFYNGNCNLEYIKILDRVSLCHSLQLRQNKMSQDGSPKPNWNPFHPIHGSLDTAEFYEKYIRNWPNNIY
jgi:aminoglycoside phosphotransferase (APT) family kinase protein